MQGLVLPVEQVHVVDLEHIFGSVPRLGGGTLFQGIIRCSHYLLPPIFLSRW